MIDWSLYANFTPEEMACRGTGTLIMDPDFLDRLQALRLECGFPFPVNRGYSTVEYDASLGGAGVHPLGKAVDLEMYGERAYTASDVDSHLGREGVDSFAPAASPLGLLAQVAATMEREIGDGIRAFHDLSSLNLAGRDGSAAASGSSSEEVAG